MYYKKIDSIRTELTQEIHFDVCPYGDSDNGTAAAARRSRDILIEPAALRRPAIEAQGHSELGAFRTAGVRNWGAQSGRKDQPGCCDKHLCVCLSACKPHDQTSQNFLYMLSVALSRYSYDDNRIRYALQF